MRTSLLMGMRATVWLLVWIAIGGAVFGCASSGEPPRRDGGEDVGVDANRDAGRDGGPVGAQICDACVDDSDCTEAMTCVRLSVGGYACLPLCNPDLPDCPRAFNCITDTAAGGDPVCEPVGGPCCVDEDGDGYGTGIGCEGRDCDDGHEDVNPGTREGCNHTDDDCDGRVDEGDACACAGGPMHESTCSGGEDEDCDGDIDCGDADCNGLACDAMGRSCNSGVCTCLGGGTETACGDGMDNDCDGVFDCGDPNCASMTSGTFGRACVGGVCACPLGTSETSCEDGADTDCDGLIDCADPDCDTRMCGLRGRVCDALACRCPGGDVEATCGDTMDNDCDGTSDCGDSDCSGDACGANGRVCITGACACPSSIERCDGRDTDCDGLSDDGCPRASTLGAPATGTIYGGGGGTAYTLDCPSGRALVGFDGGSGSGLDRLTPVCATVSLSTDTSTSPDYTYRVTTSTTGALPSVGGAGGTAFSDRCPANEIVIGLRGRSGTEVDQISFQCGRVTVTRDVSSAWVATVTPTGTSTARGGGGGTPFTYDCPAGRVVTGIIGRAGVRIDQIAARCATAGFTVF